MRLKDYLPTLAIVLVLVIVSMMVVNYFNIDLGDNSGLGVLKKAAVFEGFKEGGPTTEQTNNNQQAKNNQQLIKKIKDKK